MAARLKTFQKHNIDLDDAIILESLSEHDGQDTCELGSNTGMTHGKITQRLKKLRSYVSATNPGSKPLHFTLISGGKSLLEKLQLNEKTPSPTGTESPALPNVSHFPANDIVFGSSG
jgi:hypothetical protein